MAKKKGKPKANPNKRKSNEPELVGKNSKNKKEEIMPNENIFKKYVLPSMIVGPIVGAGVTAATSSSKEDFKKNVTKGALVGLGADIATGVGIGAWNKYAPQIKTFLKRAEMEKQSHIVERKDGWHLMSSDGSKHLGGPYPSRAGALKRERQVEYFKHQKTAEEKYDDLPVGREIEHEHEPTLERIKGYLAKHKTLPNIDWLANSIAHDHLNEFSNYYCDHEGLPKMERKLQKEKDKTKTAEVAAFQKLGKKLTESAREHISKKNFALAGGRYPIEDKNHARNALARVAQHGTPAEKARVRAKVHAKYPGIDEKKAEYEVWSAFFKELNLK